MADGHRSGGFLESGNVWVLIPLAGISIPILAILTDEDSDLTFAIGVVLVVAAVTAAMRHLLVLRHRLRMEELAAQERISRAESERFAAIDRLVEPAPLLRSDLQPERTPPER